jgi:zinc protease
MKTKNARDKFAKVLARIVQDAPDYGTIKHVESLPFSGALELERFVLENGLHLLLLVDSAAPVVAYHTWFRVGSRHEKPGKTGLAHLFEHLMFNAMEGLPPGEFDKRMEASGADNNASTWLDFTQYQESFPKDQLAKIVELEALRMHRLTLGQTQLDSEKDVVKNERRFRVEDDVDGRVEELLWKTAFEKHPYHAPTIGWMSDIEGFTIDDCLGFYRRYYAPANATLVLVGDFRIANALTLIRRAYGKIPRESVPFEDTYPEPVQTEERRVEVTLSASSERVVLGYKGPALGDQDHVPLSLLVEILTGGGASRLPKRLIRAEGLVSDVRASVGPHRDPSLIEFSASARQGVSAERVLQALESELERVRREPVSQAELDRARARARLALLSGLETADGKASTLGFYETVLRRPLAAFERLRAMDDQEPSDLLRVARRYLDASARTVILQTCPKAEASSPELEGAA